MEEMFAKEELERLLLMVAVGNWVINGVKEKSLIEFEEIEQKFYQYALDQGLEKYFNKDDLSIGIFPNKALEKLMMEYIDEYNNHIFWQELEDSLVDRDMIKKYGVESINKMELEERLEKEEEFHEKYNNEFSDNGLNNIEISN
ncbi:MAG: hypothetical protein LHV68_01580 [Elusimicrobia bacterium]|nr:hypothetical protein [Candidatus Liberimonas magnetica]